MNYKLLKGLFYIVLSISILTSCQRDEISLPTEESNTPVFYFNANLDGQNANLVAGVDEKYMHTDHELDQFNITTFVGHIGEESCTDMCEGTFRFALRDYDTTDKTVLSKGLPPASFPFRNNVEVDEGGDVYRVSFNSIYNEDKPSFAWNFGDDTYTFSVADPVHIYKEPTEFYYPSFRNFINENNEQELAWKARQLPISPQGVPLSTKVNANMNFENLGGNRVRISMEVEEDGMEFIPSLAWDVLKDPLNSSIDEAETIVTTTDHAIEIEITEKTQIGAFPLFLNSNTGAVASIDLGTIVSFDSAGELEFTKVDYNYEVEEITNGARLALASFDLQYMDESGKFYSSALGEQTNDAYFDIKSVEEYLDNVAGQKTRKLEVETSCRLYADDGESILLTNGEGVIAVGVPD